MKERTWPESGKQQVNVKNLLLRQVELSAKGGLFFKSSEAQGRDKIKNPRFQLMFLVGVGD